MANEASSWVVVALVFSIVSLVLAALAYWRSAGRAHDREGADRDLAKSVRHIDGSLRILTARAETRAAEKLADIGEFTHAEHLLEDAIAKVRDARLHLSNDGEDEAVFSPVIDALHEAIRAVRARAQDHKRTIDSVLEASDSLLASLGQRGRAAATAE